MLIRDFELTDSKVVYESAQRFLGLGRAFGQINPETRMRCQTKRLALGFNLSTYSAPQN